MILPCTTEQKNVLKSTHKLRHLKRNTRNGTPGTPFKAENGPCEARRAVAICRSQRLFAALKRCLFAATCGSRRGAAAGRRTGSMDAPGRLSGRRDLAVGGQLLNPDEGHALARSLR